MKSKIILLLCGAGASLSAREFFANETAVATVPVFLTFANQLSVDDQGWVQLSPYGDFPNVDGKGRKVIQRFQKPDAEAIVNEFNSLSKLPQRLLGLPWYVGHPDHPRFKGQPGHTDSSSKGRIKELAVRDDGLYANVKFNGAGKQLIDDDAYHGHSVNWAAVPSGSEGGVQIFRPLSLKSVGFTNQPQIPVKPASLANEEDEELANAVIPPKLKLIAGFKEDEDVTMEQILAALEKAHPIANEMALASDALLATLFLSNAKGESEDVPPWVHEALGTKPEDGKEAVQAALKDKVAKAGHIDKVKKTGEEMRKAQDKHYTARKEMEQTLANERIALANERKARAILVVEPLVKAGKIITADKAQQIEALCNAGDKFDEVATQLANGKAVIKTTSKTGDLAGKHAALVKDTQTRAAKFEEMMTKREQEFPNESYEQRYTAVGNSAEGQQLFAQMTRPVGPEKD